jgi:hypothetical protein
MEDYTLIGLFDVIEHIEDDIKFLNEIYEKVSVGTFIFVNVPAMMHLFSETDEFAGHFRRYNKKDKSNKPKQIVKLNGKKNKNGRPNIAKNHRVIFCLSFFVIFVAIMMTKHRKNI